MKHGSLFSGIGGFDLAAEWMGWENKFHCEWNKFGQTVLKHYWPNAESFNDITKTDFKKYANKIDILTGGFPCQPYSQAGKRLGKEDDRHLWPEMLRAIQEIQPKYIVGENVSGLINWNGGMVFNEVQIDLENQGYQVTPFILPACAVNAPHRRDRVWFVAYSYGSRINREEKHENCDKDCGNGKQSDNTNNDGEVWRSTSDTENMGRKDSQPEFGKRNQNDKRESSKLKEGWNKIWPVVDGYGKKQSSSNPTGIRGTQDNWKGESRFINETSKGDNWKNFPTQSPICDGNDGFSSILDGITFPKWRNESIKAGGNAIVPQVALQIFKAIEQFEKLNINENEQARTN